MSEFPAGLTLADCGLDSIELINGGRDDCPSYRSLDVAAVPIRADGTVLICNASLADCDFGHSGQATLRDGWLQNGPHDGVAFVGRTPKRYIYEFEADRPCASASDLLVGADPGALIDGEDEVLASCPMPHLDDDDGARPRERTTWERVPWSMAPPRLPLSCVDPDPGLPDSGAGSPTTGFPVEDPTEGAPETLDAGTSQVTGSVEPPTPGSLEVDDAGFHAAPEPGSTQAPAAPAAPDLDEPSATENVPPFTPSCRIGAPRESRGGAGFGAVLFGLSCLVCRRVRGGCRRYLLS
jgi:hypothetical protein